ncbi:26S proteasome non-ATPase regulatory subunit 12 [Globomyces sp. JEL0801]|nr:26S proteasome non-ATPase regulatory subunit 12 [Globomyces sp. JEL0801]
MEKDWSKEVAEGIQKSNNAPLLTSLDQLALLEKHSRTSADLASNTKVLLQIIHLCYKAKDFKLLNENIVLLSKKRALLKQAVTKMIQQAIIYVDELKDLTLKLELIDTLRTVTDGKVIHYTITLKIFVEVERARLTRTLTNIKESEGKIVEAAELLQELQVETYGSMEKREKTDFILEQFRLCLAKKDYVRAQIISRKISTKFFEDPQYSDLKIRYYTLMIQHSIHGDEFLKTCKNYRSLYDTPIVKENDAQWKEALTNSVLFITLAPFDNEQSDLIHRINQDPQLAKLPLIKNFLKCFITNELMRWSKIDELYGATLKATNVFPVAQEEGKKRYEVLHKREAEEFLSDLVVKKTIYARIDRLAGIVNFEAKKDANSVLNEWSNTIHSLLDLIVKTNHLIAKEEMVHSITKNIE